MSGEMEKCVVCRDRAQDVIKCLQEIHGLLDAIDGSVPGNAPPDAQADLPGTIGELEDKLTFIGDTSDSILKRVARIHQKI